LSYRRPPQLWRHTPFLRRQADHIDAFIALSQSSADNHARFGFSKKMKVLPSFLPGIEGAKDAKVVRDKPYALFVGRLEILKGLQDVIPAFRAHEDIELLIIGDGDYSDQLRALAAGASNIHFLGRKAPAEVEAYYAGATAVILPSVCLEVFPLVALEAFRAGAPIIARNCGPFPEIVEKSGAGVLFNSADEIGPAVRRFAGDAGLRDEIGRRAKRAFAENWSEAVAIGAYLNLIGEIAISRGLDGIAEKAAIAAQRLARAA
jgi:glycosyltransferase involved in cell wall biosynthesis